MSDCEMKRGADKGELHCQLSEKSADHAVKKVFAILGVDIDKPESVEEFRSDLRFGKKLRRAADHGSLVLTGAVILGLCYAVLGGVISKIQGR